MVWKAFNWCSLAVIWSMWLVRHLIVIVDLRLVDVVLTAIWSKEFDRHLVNVVCDTFGRCILQAFGRCGFTGISSIFVVLHAFDRCGLTGIWLVWFDRPAERMLLARCHLSWCTSWVFRRRPRYDCYNFSYCKKMSQHLKSSSGSVLHRHRGGRTGNINAWYLNTHMVYL